MIGTRAMRTGPIGLLRGRDSNDEIVSLRAQLAEERLAMQRLLEEQAIENSKKEEALGMLTSKLKRLQKSLNRTEKERKLAVGGKERAETENLHLRKLLHIRDKELQALNLHIAVSETNPTLSSDAATDENSYFKSRDALQPVDVPSVDVKIPENQVTKMMTNLELQLSIRDEHVEKLNAEMKNLKNKMLDSLALQRMLRESEGQQTLMKTQLGRMERDYDEVLAAVTQCFDRMKSMAMNFKVRETERNEIIWKANRTIVEQRADHLKNCKKMAQELYLLQTRLKQLEGASASTVKDILADGKEGKVVPLDQLVLDNARVTAFTFLQLEHDRAMKRLAEENEVRMTAIQNGHTQQLQALHNSLLDKERLVADLREDISSLMNRLMNMSTEISRLEEHTPADKAAKNTHPSDMEDSPFSDVFDQLDGSLSDCEQVNEATTEVVPKTLFSDADEEDATVALEMRLYETLKDENEEEKKAASHKLLDAKNEAELMELRREKSEMLVKFSELSESIQGLERRIETEEATVNLLKTNLEMMEQALIEKDLRIRSLMFELRQKEEALTELSRSIDQCSTFSSHGASENDNLGNLEAEIAVLKDKCKTESVIMQGMIRVLNGQLYQAMKALEDEQKRSRSSGSMPFDVSTEEESVDQRVATLEKDLQSLHKRAQMALQLSQAEVAALKSKLEQKQSASTDQYTLGLDWLSPRTSHSPSQTPPGTPYR